MKTTTRKTWYPPPPTRDLFTNRRTRGWWRHLNILDHWFKIKYSTGSPGGSPATYQVLGRRGGLHAKTSRRSFILGLVHPAVVISAPFPSVALFSDLICSAPSLLPFPVFQSALTFIFLFKKRLYIYGIYLLIFTSPESNKILL